MNNAEIFIIFNPTSGSCNVRKIQNYEAALKARGIDAKIHETHYSGHATEIAQDISRRASTACMVLDAFIAQGRVAIRLGPLYLLLQRQIAFAFAQCCG